jgi:hypothetical protein
MVTVKCLGPLDLAPLEALGEPGKGRPGYDPRMLAVLLIYAYCQGIRSSRDIEGRCRTDAAFRIAMGNRVPDHSTICPFRAGAAGEGGPLEDLFAKVLFVLAAAGLGRLEVISVDGPPKAASPSSRNAPDCAASPCAASPKPTASSCSPALPPTCT